MTLLFTYIIPSHLPKCSVYNQDCFHTPLKYNEINNLIVFFYISENQLQAKNYFMESDTK